MLFIIYFSLLPFLFAFYLVALRRMTAARGTRVRYYYASLCRVLQWPALAFPLFGMAHHISEHSFYLLPLDAFTFYFVLVAVRQYRRDDDDDFWSQFKKRARKAMRDLKARAAGLRPALPLPQGA